MLHSNFAPLVTLNFCCTKSYITSVTFQQTASTSKKQRKSSHSCFGELEVGYKKLICVLKTTKNSANELMRLIIYSKKKLILETKFKALQVLDCILIVASVTGF